MSNTYYCINVAELRKRLEENPALKIAQQSDIIVSKEEWKQWFIAKNV